MNTGNVIKVIDKLSQETMSTFSLDDAEKAYEFAKQMEEVGFDVELKSPTVIESLKETLGLNKKQISELDDFRHDIHHYCTFRHTIG